jgi:hypothetical protein
MRRRLFFVSVAVALWCASTHANPIPVPLPASMPLEAMQVQISPSGGGFHASFQGDFTFNYIPISVTSMMFPVPVDATEITAEEGGVPLSWTWSSLNYPTVLPEMPQLPMIQWSGPFPMDGGVFSVHYEHSLIHRTNEFVFLYALGTGKYFPTYEKVTTAVFDILLPGALTVNGIWLDQTLVDRQNYQIADGHLSLTLNSLFGPFTKDLIMSLVPTLKIARSGTDVVLCWSTNATAFMLQSRTNLAATDTWRAVTNAPVIVGDHCYVTNAITGSACYYRLSE